MRLLTPRIALLLVCLSSLASTSAKAGRDGIIEYDLRTQLERRYEAPMIEGPVEALPAGDPVDFDPSSMGTANKDFSGPLWITDPTAGSYPRHVRISVDYTPVAGGPKKETMCSGTLISPNHVLTACHCVYTHDDNFNSWATYVEVQPGHNDGVNGPWGTAFATDIRSWDGWPDSEDEEEDIALLTLSRPVGALVGWRGVDSSDDWDFFDDPLWQMFAYPGASYVTQPNLGGRHMYEFRGNYDYDDAPMYGSNTYGYMGTSGAGSMKNGLIYAVRTHAESTIWDDNDMYDTAITSEWLGDLQDWVDADFPQTSDIQPLDFQADISSALAGDPLDNASFLVHNKSDVPHTAGVLYTVYLGDSEVTNQADTYIYDGFYVPAIPARGSARVYLPPMVVPEEAETGDYYLGVFLTTVDYNYGNNMTREQDTYPLSVTCAPQGVPVLVFPEDGHPCVGNDITLNWGSVPGAGIDYKVSVGKTTSANDFYEITSSTQHTFYGLEDGTTYYWKVKVLPACGGGGEYSSPPFSFRVSGTNRTITTIAPEPEARCIDGSVLLEWDSQPDANQYRIRLHNSTTSSTQTISTTNPFYQLTGLDDDSTYEWKVQWQDICTNWSPFGEIQYFHTVSSVATAPLPLDPRSGEFAPPATVLTSRIVQGADLYEFAIETDQGLPITTLQGPDRILSVQSPLSDGSYRWRARARVCMPAITWSDWSTWADFQIDGEAPTFAQPPEAISPTPGVWGSSDLVTVSWTDAVDNCCVNEYWLSVDQNPTTIPDNTTTSQTSGVWEFTVPEGQNWFHLVAVDDVGNVSEAQHVGPFLVDLGPPSEPIVVTDLIVGDWSNATSVTASLASTDAGSGIAGYYTRVHHNAGADPQDFAPDSEVSLPIIGDDTYYVHVKAEDVLGNQSTVVHHGPFHIDQTVPIVNAFFPAFGTVQGGDIHQFFFVWGLEDPFTQSPHDQWLIKFSADGGATFPISRDLTAQEIDDRTVSWTVPAVSTSQGLLRFCIIDEAGNVGLEDSNPFVVTQVTAVTDAVPSTVVLHKNYPNPFNPRTTIRYSLPKESSVRLEVFDASGRRVRTLVNERQPGPGHYEIVWDGIDAAGLRVSSGVYLYQLRAGDVMETKRMVLLK